MSGTRIDPGVSETRLETDLRCLDIGHDEGATIATGGERLRRGTDGYPLAPTLVIESTNDMRINREEIFGPIASVIRVRDYADTLDVANNTTFGLSAGICTTSLNCADDLLRRSTARTKNLDPVG